MSVPVIKYDLEMVRWEPDARGRLERAALELYQANGFEQTTVVDIAKRAGLTERTFFRYFADKREVLFGGAAALQDLLVRTLADTAATMAPIDAVGAAYAAAAAMMQPGRSFASARQSVIASNPELQERELVKLASLSAALADTLRGRGVPDPAASLTAEAGTAVFRVAFARWIAPANERDFAELIHCSMDELKAVAAGTGTQG